MGRSIDGEFCNIIVFPYLNAQCLIFLLKMSTFCHHLLSLMLFETYITVFFFVCVTQKEIFRKMLFWTLLTFIAWAVKAFFMISSQ